MKKSIFKKIFIRSFLPFLISFFSSGFAHGVSNEDQTLLTQLVQECFADLPGNYQNTQSSKAIISGIIEALTNKIEQGAEITAALFEKIITDQYKSRKIGTFGGKSPEKQDFTIQLFKNTFLGDANRARLEQIANLSRKYIKRDVVRVVQMVQKEKPRFINMLASLTTAAIVTTVIAVVAISYGLTTFDPTQYENDVFCSINDNVFPITDDHGYTKKIALKYKDSITHYGVDISQREIIDMCVQEYKNKIDPHFQFTSGKDDIYAFTKEYRLLQNTFGMAMGNTLGYYFSSTNYVESLLNVVNQN